MWKAISALLCVLLLIGVMGTPPKKSAPPAEPVKLLQTAPVPVTQAPEPPPTVSLPPPVAAPQKEPEVRYISGSRVPLRASPDGKAAILDRMNDGFEVYELERTGTWIKVRHSLSQQEGWVSKARLTSVKPAPKDEKPVKKPESVKTLTQAAIVALLIERSVSAYRERRPCACPYNTDRGGRSCGARSAWSRPGGAKPLCYAGDVTKEMVAGFRE